jgi:hypothetical protein
VKQIRKRITYANVMSSIAVFLVLGGATAYAAKKIGSNEIKGNSITTGKIKKEAVSASKLKKNSVTTPKIANGAVTGAKLNLGTVGTVPNATHAINADNANNANTVAGNTIRKFFYASNQTAAKTVILSLNGLTLTAGCEGEIPSLIATTSVDHSLIHAGGTYLTATPFYVEEDDFELGDNVDILEEEFDSVQGTLTYAQPSGAVVTATFESEEGGFAGFDTDCVISGDAIG